MFRVMRTTIDALNSLDALHRSLAIVEFDTEGRVISGNSNFCALLEYQLSDIKGQNYSMFVEPHYARSADYAALWEKLGRGEFDAREYKQIGRNGKGAWVQATYHPIKNARGAIVKIIAVVSDITSKMCNISELEQNINALSRFKAIASFTKSGQLITANTNFLILTGYNIEDIRGRPHRMFVDPAYARSREYANFWSKLNRGEFVAQEFKRISKAGRAVWIQGYYNPIFDMNGNVIKIVSFETDITNTILALEDIRRLSSQFANSAITRQINRPCEQPFEKLQIDFNLATDKLRNLMREVSTATQSVSRGSEDVASAARYLSRRSERQAASLEEEAKALERLTAAVMRSSEGARQASNGVSQARADAIRSEIAVSEAAAAIGEIEQSVGRINRIIGVIEEIALQTNALALNAEAEAARAGDAGVGFTAVAQEARILAQHSTGAANEIKSLLASTSEQAQRGVDRVMDIGRCLRTIVASTTQIDAAISEIARSSQEQALDLSYANAAVHHMDQAAQENATIVEKATAAASNVKLVADTLSRLVRRFDRGDQGSGPAPLPALPAGSTPGAVVYLKPRRASSQLDPDGQGRRHGPPAATLAFPSSKNLP